MLVGWLPPHCCCAVQDRYVAMFWKGKGASHTRHQTFLLCPAGGEFSAWQAEIKSRRLFLSYLSVYHLFCLPKDSKTVCTVLCVFSVTIKLPRRLPTSHCCENNYVEVSLVQMNNDGDCAVWQPALLRWRVEQKMHTQAQPITTPLPFLSFYSSSSSAKKKQRLIQVPDLHIFFHTIFIVIVWGYVNFWKYQNA